MLSRERIISPFVKVVFCVSLALISMACGREIDRKLVDAAAGGNLASVKLWIEQGANVEALENDGWTSLTIASREGHLEIVRLLIEKGANVNKLEGGGHTALFWANRNGHKIVADFLSSKGCKNV